MTDQPSENPFTISDFRWKEFTWDGNRYLVGVLKNNTAKRFSTVHLEFNLYDKKGNQVGNTSASVSNLEPHGTWKFEAIVLEDRAREAKLANVIAA